MQKLKSVALWSVVASVVTVGRVDAGPAWCPPKDQLTQGTVEELTDPQRSVGDQAAAAVYLTCADPKYVSAADRQAADAARAKIGERLALNEDEWADVAAWSGHHDRSEQVNLELRATNDKAAWSTLDPIEQYAVIQRPIVHAPGSLGPTDPAYAADVFGASLSESGRVAYLRQCLHSDKPVAWAMCEGDLDALDSKKLAAELHADKAHDGYARMTIRLAYDEVRARAPQRADEIKKLVARDPAYGKLFDIAAAQRKDWAARWKASGELVALAAAMDDALVTSSRRASEGCRDKTWEALKKAVAKLPAKSFATPRKSADETYFYDADVEQTVIGTLLADPDAYLASASYALCDALESDPGAEPDHLAGPMFDRLSRWPGYRGPRSSTFTAILLANIQFDDRSAHLETPDFARFWFRRSGGGAGGIDAVVDSVKPSGKTVTIAFQHKLAKIPVDTGCKQTNRIHSVRSDGSLEYEVTCTGTKMSTIDKKPSPTAVQPRYAQGLKPGMPVVIEHDVVLAAWSKPGTPVPSIVLGVAVK